MNFKFKRPFDLDKINFLSESEKLDYLEFLCKYAEQYKIASTKIYEEDENKLLTKLAMHDIISIVVIEEKYWEHQQWYLTVKDFDRLNEEYDESVINEYIRRFSVWDGKGKKDRRSIKGTLQKWMKKANEGISEEIVKFMERSYNAYCNSTGVTNGSRLAYNKLVIGYINKGYTVDEIRGYWKLVIPKEVNKNRDSKYRRKPENPMGEFEEYMKLRK